METKPLFVVTSRRVYRPDETPPNVQERACEREGIDLDPSILTDRLRESFSEELAEHGLSYRTGKRDDRGPFWTLDCQGAEVGVSIECDDLPKYCGKRGIVDPNVQRLSDSGDLALRSKAGGRDGCRTEDDSEDTLRDDDGPELNGLARRIREDFTDYVKGLARRMHKDVETDRDFLTSWECVKESAEANECGFDDTGAMVPLSDCEEREGDS